MLSPMQVLMARLPGGTTQTFSSEGPKFLESYSSQVEALCMSTHGYNWEGESTEAPSGSPAYAHFFLPTPLMQ